MIPPVEPPDPPTPPVWDPADGNPRDPSFAGDLPSGWGTGHLGGATANETWIVTVGGNVGEDMVLNAITLPNGTTGADKVTITGTLQGGNIYGDAKVFGTGVIASGADTINVGTVAAGSTVYGDACELASSPNLTCGFDVISVGQLSGNVVGDIGSVESSKTVFGNDTISVDTVASGAFVYGDAISVSGTGLNAGSDNITVGQLSGTIVGDVGSVAVSPDWTQFGSDSSR